MNKEGRSSTCRKRRGAQECTPRFTIRRGFSTLHAGVSCQKLVNRTTRFSYRTDVDADRVFLTAQWQHLAMLNYEVDASLLLPFVPAGTEIDRFEGKIFASLVGFRFLKTKLFGFVPVPMYSNFEEVNLRFYVRRQEHNEIRRGVVFIQE